MKTWVPPRTQSSATGLAVLFGSGLGVQSYVPIKRGRLKIRSNRVSQRRCVNWDLIFIGASSRNSTIRLASTEARARLRSVASNREFPESPPVGASVARGGDGS